MLHPSVVLLLGSQVDLGRVQEKELSHGHHIVGPAAGQEERWHVGPRKKDSGKDTEIWMTQRKLPQ